MRIIPLTIEPRQMEVQQQRQLQSRRGNLGPEGSAAGRMSQQSSRCDQLLLDLLPSAVCPMARMLSRRGACRSSMHRQASRLTETSLLVSQVFVFCPLHRARPSTPQCAAVSSLCVGLCAAGIAREPGRGVIPRVG